MRLESEIRQLVASLSGKVVLKDAVLRIASREWIITGVKPDKAHDMLNVFYKDRKEDEENKVDFYDFHPDTYLLLINLIKEKI